MNNLHKKDFLAWCAGFYEGEGSIGCYKDRFGRPKKLQLSVTQNEKEVLQKIAEFWGFGTITADKRKRCHSWTVTKAEDILSFCNRILPYLQSNYKREQMNSALFTFLNRPPGKRTTEDITKAIRAYKRKRDDRGKFI